jgi:uncharacterized membrane protein
MTLARGVALVAQLLEIAGVGAIAVGALVAAVRLVLHRDRPAYHAYRQDLGRAILLGLEFLVGADIIRTVSAAPTLRGVVVLGLVVAVRTFLSFTLAVELEGRWPWQRLRDPARTGSAPSDAPAPRLQPH